MKVKSKRFQGVYIYQSTQRDDECYYVSFQSGGKKITKKVGWKSQGHSQHSASAHRIGLIMESKRPAQKKVQADQIYNFSNAFDMYMDASELSMSSDRKELVKGRYYKHLHWELGAYSLGDISSSRIRSLLRKLEHQGLSRSTVKKYFQLIKAVFKFMGMEIGLDQNPCDNVKYSVTDRSRQRYLTKHEAKMLLVSMKKTDDDLYLQTVIGLFTGMRLGEIMELRYVNIDFESDLIHVRGKGRNRNKKERTVEMTPVVREAILKHSDWKFGKVFDAGFRRITFQKVVDSIGLNDDCSSNIWKVTPHTLRHTFGSWLGQDGIAPQIIQQLMGHSNVETSMRYVKLGPRAGKKAVANLVKGMDI